MTIVQIPPLAGVEVEDDYPSTGELAIEPQPWVQSPGILEPYRKYGSRWKIGRPATPRCRHR